MRLFSGNNHSETPAQPAADPQTDVEAATMRLAEAALALIDAAREALRTEDDAFTAWGKSEVRLWFVDFDAKKRAMLDYAISHRRDFEDAARLIRDGRADLVDLTAIREFKARYEAADSARRAAPGRQRPPQVHTILPRLRLPVDAELMIGELIGPEKVHSGLLERALNDWKWDLTELPADCFCAVGSGRDLIFRQGVIAGRLAQEEAAGAYAEPND